MELSNKDYDLRKQMLSDLKLLSKTEYMKVFEVIKKSKVEYSENSNGIFFDLVKLTTETFTELSTYMEFCQAVRKEQASRDNEEREAQDLLHA